MTTSSETAGQQAAPVVAPPPPIGTFTLRTPHVFVRENVEAVQREWTATARSRSGNCTPPLDLEAYIMMKLLLPTESEDIIICDWAVAAEIIARLEPRLASVFMARLR